MTSTRSTTNREHLKGEHSRWCQQRKGNVLYCKWTGGVIRTVEMPKVREAGDAKLTFNKSTRSTDSRAR
jgi:hypothetical protein